MPKELSPALLPSEWADKATDGLMIVNGRPYVSMVDASVIEPESIPGWMALLNATLPDSDPRKITRAKIDCMRQTARTLRRAMHREGAADEVAVPADVISLAQQLEAFADAIETYLPKNSK